MGALQRMVEWIEAHGVFERRRTDNETRAQEVVVYRRRLGYDKAGQLLGVSPTAVWEWVHRCLELLTAQKVPRRRCRLAIDEKEVKVRGRSFDFRPAVDLDRGEVEVLVT